MSLLDSFIHGDALSQIMIEGHNPHARQKLDMRVAEALRPHIHAPDTLLAYVCGREVQAGAVVWAITRQQLLLVRGAKQAVTRCPLNQIQGVEAVRGKYGHTLRVHTAERTHAIFGVDRDLAHAMHQALSESGVTSTFDNRPSLGTLWAAYSGPHPSAEQCLADARQRLMA